MEQTFISSSALVLLLTSSIFNVVMSFYVLYKTRGFGFIGIISFLVGGGGVIYWVFFPEVAVDFSVYQVVGLGFIWVCSLLTGFFAMVKHPLFRVRKAYWKEAVGLSVSLFLLVLPCIFGWGWVTINILFNSCQVFLASLQIGKRYMRNYADGMRILIGVEFVVSLFVLLIICTGF